VCVCVSLVDENDNNIVLLKTDKDPGKRASLSVRKETSNLENRRRE